MFVLLLSKLGKSGSLPLAVFSVERKALSCKEPGDVTR